MFQSLSHEFGTSLNSILSLTTCMQYMENQENNEIFDQIKYINI